jgi:CRP/FNR family transcriptional regulator
MRPEIKNVLQCGKNELISAMSATPQVLRRGEILVHMDDLHEYVYLIESGWFSRNRQTPDGRRQLILILLPGDVCGIKGLFLIRQQDAIEAVTAASVRSIHHEQAYELALKDSAVAMYLAWRFAQDERRLHDWIVRLGRANAEERLASLLLELRNRLSLLGMTRSEGRYALPLTLQQIADHIGVTRVHVSRMLQRFRDSKLLTIERNQVVFLENMEAVEELAQPVFDEIGSLSEDV